MPGTFHNPVCVCCTCACVRVCVCVQFVFDTQARVSAFACLHVCFGCVKGTLCRQTDCASVRKLCRAAPLTCNTDHNHSCRMISVHVKINMHVCVWEKDKM